MNSINDIFKIYYTPQQLKKLKKARIMIIGCGGLGSNIANMLIRSAFINIMLIDYDKVELKNLNRQQFYPQDIGEAKAEVLKKRLLNINPYAKIETVIDIIDKKKLKKLIKKFKPDIIVEAVDKAGFKKVIFETSLKLNKTIISASGVAGYGDVEKIKVIRKEKYTIIGDLISECKCCDISHKDKNIKNKCLMPLAPKVTAVAAMQADEVIRRILKGTQ